MSTQAPGRLRWRKRTLRRFETSPFTIPLWKKYPYRTALSTLPIVWESCTTFPTPARYRLNSQEVASGRADAGICVLRSRQPSVLVPSPLASGRYYAPGNFPPTLQRSASGYRSHLAVCLLAALLTRHGSWRNRVFPWTRYRFPPIATAASILCGLIASTVLAIILSTGSLANSYAY